ncbi:hypothetical protein A4X13_0g9363 [Tilletia indica]|uniref:Uncharacterized protein n=1 Tax=Tilletia indica TaxID=43049 RepID=A0A8T8SA03_9BASI|nr:hypothetical protein A4X13_0g9363 [Tilletia indica]
MPFDLIGKDNDAQVSALCRQTVYATRPIAHGPTAHLKFVRLCIRGPFLRNMKCKLCRTSIDFLCTIYTATDFQTSNGSLPYQRRATVEFIPVYCYHFCEQLSSALPLHRKALLPATVARTNARYISDTRYRTSM